MTAWNFNLVLKGGFWIKQEHKLNQDYKDKKRLFKSLNRGIK